MKEEKACQKLKGKYESGQHPLERLRNKLCPYFNIVSMLQLLQSLPPKHKSEKTLSNIVKDELGKCSRELNDEIHAYLDDIETLLNSDQKVQECDATAAQSSEEPLAPKNPLEDITECYVPCELEEADGYFSGIGDETNYKQTTPVKRITLPSPAVKDEAFNDETIDTVGKCANCGVEYHIHKESVKDDWKERFLQWYSSEKRQTENDVLGWIETNLKP